MQKEIKVILWVINCHILSAEERSLLVADSLNKHRSSKGIEAEFKSIILKLKYRDYC